MAASWSSTFDIAYSPLSRLNSLDVHLPPSENTQENRKKGYWVIYIHGGGWRDPAIDARTISPILPYLDPAVAQIEGIGSLNYRLSPYVNHPTDPSGDDPARNVTHPQHIEDVLTALSWLQLQYRFGERYILVGHSVGATLAFQAVSGIWQPRVPSTDSPLYAFLPSVAIAGVSGIYDLKALIESFSSIPVYRQIVEGAMGSDEQLWAEASPVNYDLDKKWRTGRVTVLADSPEDGLIDEVQSERMWSGLKSSGSSQRADFRMDLTGEHDTIWSEGKELARVILHTLDLLKEQDEPSQP